MLPQSPSTSLFNSPQFSPKFNSKIFCTKSNFNANKGLNIAISKTTKGFILKKSDKDSLTKLNSVIEERGIDEVGIPVSSTWSGSVITGEVIGLFAVFFIVGVVFDKLWTLLKRRRRGPELPARFSMLWGKDLQRKESVEWVNMVLGKLWKVYKVGIEDWMIGLMQPVIDDLQKPEYVERVEIKEFDLGYEPLCVRNVERRTSRRVDDLQYQIGVRYTGGARMLLMLSLKFGIIPVVVPVGVQDFDIDGELWVKLRLIPKEPWVGAASWAFVSLPKIKFDLSAFRMFNLMTIPVLSMFLTKLLTEDLPQLFVRPQKVVLDFQEGKAVGPIANDFDSKEIQGGNDSVGELSVTLVDAQELSRPLFGKTDPYVILRLGDQVLRSKKNSQTTVIGPPGQPIWNQDFHMRVTNPIKQKLHIQVKDTLGFSNFTVGTGEVDLGALPDTVPTDRIVVLQRGWGLFRKKPVGKILLRLTYKAYVEDEEDVITHLEPVHTDASYDKLADSDKSKEINKESFMDDLASLLVSKEFQGIVASETQNNKILDDLSSREIASSHDFDAKFFPATTKPSNGFKGSVLFWMAVITSLSVLIAINVSGSSFFGP